MISKITQESLFPHKTNETLDKLSISIANASQLFEDGYISFDPSIKTELNEFEYLELYFVGTLFNSGLSLESVNTLLSKLEKPYYYDISKVYFDFKNKEWELIPIPEEPSAEELIENIIQEEDYSRLIEIRNRILNILDKNILE